MSTFRIHIFPLRKLIISLPRPVWKLIFYLPDTRQLIQLAQDIHSPVTRERELRALFDALKSLDIQQGLILTETSQDTVRQDDKVVVIRSIAEWLLA